jgi:transcriptional regulator with XRE-family HTH domain
MNLKPHGDNEANCADLTTGARLRALRERERLSQVRMAELLGVARRTLIGWERDEAEPGAQTLRQLRALFDVDPEWIIAGRTLVPQAQMLAVNWDRLDHIRARIESACQEARIALDEDQIRDLVRIIYDEGAQDDLESGRLLRMLRIISQER